MDLSGLLVSEEKILENALENADTWTDNGCVAVQ